MSGGTVSIPSSTHNLTLTASGPSTAGARHSVQIIVDGLIKGEAVSTTVTNMGRIAATSTYSF